MLFLVAVIAFVLFLLGRGRTFRSNWSETGLLALKAILILLLFVVVVALALAPVPSKASSFEEPISDSSGLIFQWYENEQYTIDLGRYFEDPDADWLEFTATQPAHIAVSIADGKAVLTPEKNWGGEDKIVFTASDQKGGVVDSPILALKVLQREHLTFRQWTYKYCTHVNLALLAMLLLVVLLALFLTFTPRRDRPFFTQPERVIVEKSARRTPEHGRFVKTFVTRDGLVRTLGDEPAKKTREPKAKTAPRVQNAVPRTKLAAKPGEIFSYTDVHGKKHVLGIAERIEWGAEKKTKAPKRPDRVQNPAPGKKRASKASSRSRSAAMDRALIAFNDKHELQTVLRRFNKRETRINLNVLQAAGKMFKQNALYKPHNRDSFHRYLVEKDILRRLEGKR